MPIALRSDFDVERVRAVAKRSKDGPQARRPLALAAIYEGASRSEAAKIGGAMLQIVRDWVLKFKLLRCNWRRTSRLLGALNFGQGPPGRRTTCYLLLAVANGWPAAASNAQSGRRYHVDRLSVGPVYPAHQKLRQFKTDSSRRRRNSCKRYAVQFGCFDVIKANNGDILAWRDACLKGAMH